MEARKVELKRRTTETDVVLELNLDGTGESRVATGIGFLDHILTLVARHSGINLAVTATGDLQTDCHHLVEDVGIVFGQALGKALSDKAGIERYGWSMLPMDEVLVACAIDLGGRFSYVSNYRPRVEKVGGLATEMVDHFFQSLAVEGRLNLHFKLLHPGRNEHHRIEAMAKAFARALKQAVRIDPQRAGQIPSTKGVL